MSCAIMPGVIIIYVALLKLTLPDKGKPAAYSSTPLRSAVINNCMTPSIASEIKSMCSFFPASQKAYHFGKSFDSQACKGSFFATLPPF